MIIFSLATDQDRLSSCWLCGNISPLFFRVWEPSLQTASEARWDGGRGVPHGLRVHPQQHPRGQAGLPVPRPGGRLEPLLLHPSADRRCHQLLLGAFPQGHVHLGHHNVWHSDNPGGLWHSFLGGNQRNAVLEPSEADYWRPLHSIGVFYDCCANRQQNQSGMNVHPYHTYLFILCVNITKSWIVKFKPNKLFSLV